MATLWLLSGYTPAKRPRLSEPRERPKHGHSPRPKSRVVIRRSTPRSDGGTDAGLAVSPLNRQITRKTMLPAILHFLAAHAEGKL